MAEQGILRDLQRGLETLYRLDPAPEVAPFLLDARHHSERDEELWIVEGDELEIGLALAPESVATLQQQTLADCNLAHFCLVVEGLSHFLFVVHRMRLGQPTSVLELELQAEVDKYVAAMMLAWRCPRLPSERLRQRLYTNYLLVDGLNVEEQHRYHNANDLARRYTRRLEERFVRSRRLPAMLGELRRFYRMPCWAKQGMIAAI